MQPNGSTQYSPPVEVMQPELPWVHYRVRMDKHTKVIACQDFLIEEGVVIFHSFNGTEHNTIHYVCNISYMVEFEPMTPVEVHEYQLAQKSVDQTAYIPRVPGVPQ